MLWCHCFQIADAQKGQNVASPSFAGFPSGYMCTISETVDKICAVVFPLSLFMSWSFGFFCLQWVHTSKLHSAYLCWIQHMSLIPFCLLHKIQLWSLSLRESNGNFISASGWLYDWIFTKPEPCDKESGLRHWKGRFHPTMVIQSSTLKRKEGWFH